MLKGLPASGKSTWAKTEVRHAESPTIRVNKDDLRMMLHNGVYSKANESQVLSARNAIVISALQAGVNVIVDDTNFQHFHETVLRSIATVYDAKFVVKEINTSLDECLKRNMLRSNSVPDYVIKEMYQEFVEKRPGTPPIYMPNARDIVICDLDGTLALPQVRDMYNPSDEDILRDKLNSKVAKHLAGRDVILTSGRYEKYRTATMKWLDIHGIKYFALYMRRNGDIRKDYVVKKEMYDQHILGKYNVDVVYDDRDQVVRLWRDLGLTCFQVAPGNF